MVHFSIIINWIFGPLLVYQKHKYQNLQEKGVKPSKQSTENTENVETEREKELKEEIKTETGGEKNASKSPRKFKNFI